MIDYYLRDTHLVRGRVTTPTGIFDFIVVGLLDGSWCLSLGVDYLGKYPDFKSVELRLNSLAQGS